MEEHLTEYRTAISSSSQKQMQLAAQTNHSNEAPHRMRQNTAPVSYGAFFQSVYTHSFPRHTRKKTNSFEAGVLARREVAMDLLPADDADLGVYEFFRPQAAPEEETKEDTVRNTKTWRLATRM